MKIELLEKDDTTVIQFVGRLSGRPDTEIREQIVSAIQPGKRWEIDFSRKRLSGHDRYLVKKTVK